MKTAKVSWTGFGLEWLGWGCALVSLAQGDPASTEAVRLGQELAAELRSLRPGGSGTNTGTLRMRDGKGHRREIPVTVVTLVAADAWSVSYRARLTNGALETLTIRYGTASPVSEVARVESGAGLAGAPRMLGVGETAVPFAGSDFWVCDLGLDFLHWPTQRYVKEELSNGRMCHVLESTNPSTHGYARVWSYIDAEFKGLLSAKAFDRRGLLMKDFSTGSFTKVQDRWFLRDIRIRDERTDTRTELLYAVPSE